MNWKQKAGVVENICTRFRETLSKTMEECDKESFRAKFSEDEMGEDSPIRHQYRVKVFDQLVSWCSEVNLSPGFILTILGYRSDSWQVLLEGFEKGPKNQAAA